MKAGIGTYAFRHAISHPLLKAESRMSFKEIVMFCADNYADAVQVCENIPLHLLSDNQLSDGLEQLKRNSITLEIGTTGYESEHLSTYINLAGSMNSKILRTVFHAKGENINHIASHLKMIIPYLEKNKVTLAIENHFDFPPHQIKSLIEKLNHPLVKICIDPLNSFTLLYGINETFDQLKTFIVTAHIKDVRIERRETGFYIIGCRLGEGVARVNEYLENIWMENQACNVFIEQWMDPCITVEDTLAEEKNRVLHGLKFLQEAIRKLTSQSYENKPSGKFRLLI